SGGAAQARRHGDGHHRRAAADVPRRRGRRARRRARRHGPPAGRGRRHAGDAGDDADPRRLRLRERVPRRALLPRRRTDDLRAARRRHAAGALAVGAVNPITLIAIRPTNRRLINRDSLADTEVLRLLGRWGRLHAVRTALGAASLLAYLYALRSR